MQTERNMPQEIKSRLTSYQYILSHEGGYEAGEEYLNRLPQELRDEMSPHLGMQQIHTYTDLLMNRGEEAAANFYKTLPEKVREDLDPTFKKFGSIIRNAKRRSESFIESNPAFRRLAIERGIDFKPGPPIIGPIIRKLRGRTLFSEWQN